MIDELTHFLSKILHFYNIPDEFLLLGGEANVLFLLDVFNVSVIMLTEADIYSVQRLVFF